VLTAGSYRPVVAALGLAITSALARADFVPLEQQTELTAKAKTLQLGMTRSEVIAVLGRPTGAVLPADRGTLKLPTDPSTRLELLWDNPPCNLVMVDFDERGLSIGWD